MGVHQREDGQWELLRDWEIIKLLNPIADKPRGQAFSAGPRMEQEVTGMLAGAEEYLQLHIKELDIPFQLPVIESLACLLPGKLGEP